MNFHGKRLAWIYACLAHSEVESVGAVAMRNLGFQDDVDMCICLNFAPKAALAPKCFMNLYYGHLFPRRPLSVRYLLPKLHDNPD